MTDDLTRLRQAMTELAEHSGTTDMYERVLHRSRQSTRHTALAAGGAAVAVALAVGGTVAFAATHQPDPSTPVGTRPPAPSAGRPSAPPDAAQPSAPPDAAQPSTPPDATQPSTAPVAEAPVVASAPPSTAPAPPSPTRAGNRPRYPACPSAKTLEGLADLPKGWSFIPSSVDCWRDWATADPQGPTTGDGFYLFHYRAGTGWRYHSQGSGYRCEDLGITTGNPPFCQLD